MGYLTDDDDVFDDDDALPVEVTDRESRPERPRLLDLVVVVVVGVVLYVAQRRLSP